MLTKSKVKSRMKETPRYGWKPGSRTAGPAQPVGEELARIEVDSGEGLTPSAVVDAGRPPGAFLHPYFEWRDGVAAEEHRKSQARSLIRSVIVIASPPEKATAPVFIHVRPPDVAPCYMSTAKVASDDGLMTQAVASCFSLLRGISSRYRFLTRLRPDLKPIFDAIDALE